MLDPREKKAMRMGKLIVRKLNGELTEAESIELEAWLAVSPENRAVHDEMFDDYSREVALAEVSPRDADAVEQDIWDRFKPHRSGTSKRWLNGTIVGVAATLLIGVSLGIYFWRNNQPQEIELSSKYGGDALPGGNRATLTFENGRTLELDENKTGIISSTSGIAYADGQQVSMEPARATYATLATPRGGQYRLTLPDGTDVWLNAASSIKYPTAFIGDERKVILSGEAFFEVKGNAKMPFIVQSEGQTLQVTGTSFNINSYSDLPTVTTLATGSVRILAGSGESVTMKPGQQSVLDGNGFKLKNVDPTDYTAWKDGVLVLNEATFEEAAREIERWYDVSFVTPRNHDSGKAYILLNRNEKLSELLQSLESVYQLKFTITGREVTVRK